MEDEMDWDWERGTFTTTPMLSRAAPEMQGEVNQGQAVPASQRMDLGQSGINQGQTIPASQAMDLGQTVPASQRMDEGQTLPASQRMDERQTVPAWQGMASPVMPTAVISPMGETNYSQPTSPRNYPEEAALLNFQMNEYRVKGKNYSWSNDTVFGAVEEWNPAVLPPGPPVLFEPDRHRFHISRFFYASRASNLSEEKRARLQEGRTYFEAGRPQFRFQRVLGAGGNGMGLHYKFGAEGSPLKDIVAKISVRGWNSWSIRQEVKMTRRLRRATHCVQSIEPHELDQIPMEDLRPEPPNDDSSEDEDSSGDESISAPIQPAPVPRRQRRYEDQDIKERAWDIRHENWSQGQGIRFDYLLLEFAPGGDFESLITKFQRMKNAREMALRIPNRVLWSIWLCLVRACVGMKYPPRKFHPFRPRPPRRETFSTVQQYEAAVDLYRRLQGELVETVPPAAKKFRAKNMVHFDIDPSNIFVSTEETFWPSPDRAPTEHLYVPRFKMADFGMAQDMKPNKRNQYYMNRRPYGKYGFIAPEQFGADWDQIPLTRDGPEVSESRIAGNYGSHTNVWGIALTMWIIITQMKAPVPPQPQLPPGIYVPPLPAGMTADRYIELLDEEETARTGIPRRTRISYCPWLWTDGGPDGFYKYVDIDLQKIIFECMYHRPDDRPTVEVLLEQAIAGVAKNYPLETDDYIREWVSTYIYGGPT